MLFKWYRSDFGLTEDEVLQWIEKNSVELGSDISSARFFAKKKGHTLLVSYSAYDWNLNL